MMSRTISFASFNLHNLNEPGLPIYSDSAGWTVEQVERKVAWSAAMLRRARADVIGFQELWHHDTLARVIGQAGMGDDYALLVPEGQRGQGIVCAAAVRRAVLEGEPRWIKDFPPAFRLQSRGEDEQTAAMFVDLKQFSRPVLCF